MMIEIKITDDGNVELNGCGTRLNTFKQVSILPAVALDILVKKAEVPATAAGNILIGAIQMKLRDLAEEKK